MSKIWKLFACIPPINTFFNPVIYDLYHFYFTFNQDNISWKIPPPLIYIQQQVILLNGKTLKHTKHSEVRFFSLSICMIYVFNFKGLLGYTVSSNPFFDYLKVNTSEPDVRMTKYNNYFDQWNIIIKMCWNLFNILMMYDSNGYKTDLLWYLVRKAEEHII